MRLDFNNEIEILIKIKLYNKSISSSFIFKILLNPSKTSQSDINGFLLPIIAYVHTIATSLINWVYTQSPKSIIPEISGSFKSLETIILLSLISLWMIFFVCYSVDSLLLCSTVWG